MEGETYTREPTSGDRLRRYNSKTMSLLGRRGTGKAALAGRVQSARVEKRVCGELCVYVCVWYQQIYRTQTLGYVLMGALRSGARRVRVFSF